MTMPPRLRKAVLTAHVTTSVGWMGAVAAYLALDITAVTGDDVPAVRSAYLAMETTAWYAIAPLALAAVLIGVVNALGTPWGLFRHHWVVAKLLLTLVATAVLLVQTRTISALARAATTSADPRELPGSMVHSVGGLVVLLAVVVLSIYKPRGLTRYGRRRQQARA
ncbi:DUF2269 domain-containing protein [Pseudonocardia humida]|uniref:DUF2269 domain-containing protein n=1 Tax=Pseudonocardia humida TaxID=2800819 RepID=A0ABT1A696_9PSEU|nr:DUF2269 domain-containing protein [Pseudonocardia humida]MCO1658543.1 DUF2269 domain-containing protein [Pseudonocardia humida]